MTISCPHCQQQMEATPEWLGLEAACPACGQTFTVADPAGSGDAPEIVVPTAPAPAPPTPPVPVPARDTVTPARRAQVSRTGSRLSPPPKKGGGFGVGKVFVLLALLVGGGLGYAWFVHGVPPSQVPQWLAGYFSKPVVPAPTPVPTATPAPTAPPPTPAVVEATPTPSTPPPPDPLAWILEHRERGPKELKLLTVQPFPAMFEGKEVGSTVAPAGSSVQVVEMGPEESRVRYLGAERTIPTASTNLLQFAASEMARPAPVAVAPPPPAAMPEPVSTPAATAPPELTDGPAPALAGGEPRVYVGSAYQPATTDLATKLNEWKTVREKAGFHEHPVGWARTFTSWNLGREMLSAFKPRYFTAEEDIGGIARGNTGTHWAETVINQGRSYGQTWRCVALVVNFHAPRMMDDPPKAAQDLRNYCDKANGLRMPYYLLFSPVSPEAVEIFDKMDKPYENKPVWVWVAQHAGAAGVAIDCPAPFIPNPRWRNRAVEIYRTTRQAKLKFIWVLNGGTDSGVTEQAAQTLRNLQVRPDYWIVSHFHDDKYPGTPEDKNGTVASQARVLIKGNY